MVRVEQRGAYAAKARRDDPRHKPTHHLDHEALLGGREAVRDHRNEIRSEQPAQRCESACHKEERVEDGATEPSDLVGPAQTHILAERRDECGHEGPVEDAKKDRRDRRGVEERVHFRARAEIVRRDDFAAESEHR